MLLVEKLGTKFKFPLLVTESPLRRPSLLLSMFGLKGNWRELKCIKPRDSDVGCGPLTAGLHACSISEWFMYLIPETLQIISKIISKVYYTWISAQINDSF